MDYILTERIRLICQSIDANGAAAVVNVSTNAFPATTGAATAGVGNAHVEDVWFYPISALPRSSS